MVFCFDEVCVAVDGGGEVVVVVWSGGCDCECWREECELVWWGPCEVSWFGPNVDGGGGGCG